MEGVKLFERRFDTSYPHKQIILVEKHLQLHPIFLGTWYVLMRRA